MDWWGTKPNDSGVTAVMSSHNFRNAWAAKAAFFFFFSNHNAVPFFHLPFFLKCQLTYLSQMIRCFSSAAASHWKVGIGEGCKMVWAPTFFSGFNDNFGFMGLSVGLWMWLKCCRRPAESWNQHPNNAQAEATEGQTIRDGGGPNPYVPAPVTVKQGGWLEVQMGTYGAVLDPLHFIPSCLRSSYLEVIFPCMQGIPCIREALPGENRLEGESSGWDEVFSCPHICSPY